MATGSLSRTRDLIILLAFCLLSDPLIQNDISAVGSILLHSTNELRVYVMFILNYNVRNFFTGYILHVSYKSKLCEKPHRVWWPPTKGLTSPVS